MRWVFTYICGVKNILVFLFLIFQIASSLAEEKTVFSPSLDKTLLANIQSESNFLNPNQNHNFFGNEIQSIQFLDQNFRDVSSLYLYKKLHSFELSFFDPFISNKYNFIFKRNLKKFLSQKIHPFHFYW